MALKRKIAIKVAKGQNTEAIAALVKYLDNFAQDSEGWVELSNLYLKENQFQQAAYCMEEIVLLNPLNHIFHLKYAEVSPSSY